MLQAKGDVFSVSAVCDQMSFVELAGALKPIKIFLQDRRSLNATKDVTYMYITLFANSLR